MDEKRLNEARFAMFHFPVILYNDQLKSVITKGELSKTEKNTFAHHSVLYLNRQMEALTFAIRDFGRYIVETMKPKTDIFKSKVFWIIIAVVVIILLALFAPAVMNAIGGFAGNTGSIIPGGSSSAATVTPIP